MRKEIQAQLEDVVALLGNPDAVVLDKEVKEKLEKIISLLDHPEEVVAMGKKMDDIIEHVQNAMIDLDVDIAYCATDRPYLLLSYAEDEYNTRTRKISLGSTAKQSSVEDFTKHVVLAIEEFKDEIDDVKMG